MDTRRFRRKEILAAAAVAAVALADRVLAWLLGSEPVLPETPDFLGTGLLVFALGHCDGMDGPVVTLARKALEAGNVNLVLSWVRKDDEPEIRHAFEHALAVRGLGPKARALADHHFFETLVRVHRAGEGAAYTGLKPAGRDLGPAIPAADRAIAEGSVERVIALLNEAVRQGVRKHFQAVMARKDFDAGDVAAGRAYVEAYVPYIHYVERLWQAASGAAHGHHAAHAEDAAHAVHEH